MCVPHIQHSADSNKLTIKHICNFTKLPKDKQEELKKYSTKLTPKDVFKLKGILGGVTSIPYYKNLLNILKKVLEKVKKEEDEDAGLNYSISPTSLTLYGYKIKEQTENVK